ncbi:ornithine cyclodeaminase family protein [Microvirga massiliensis]|uniref:ornithine cyclodeaminase family protein n=1 Tax=Microvirga massiliensis TaxID=1033741 RepID=UPI00062BD5EC|nr:hypothetical protein [Microvirga massiliensis]
MKLLSESEVRNLIDPDEAIRASAEAFRLLSSGSATVPLRTEIPLPGGGVFFIMPGLVADKYLGFKLIANRPDESHPSGLHTVSMILVIDAQSVTPVGLLSSDWFTDFRTAAGLAAATDALAPKQVRTLAVYGAGKLAEPSVRLLCRVRNFERVILVGRTSARVEALAARLRNDRAFAEMQIDHDVSPDEAASVADVITTVTSATEPVFDGSKVRPGVHINIAGAFRPEWREIDDQVAGRAIFYLDSMSAGLERAGDIRIPLQSGVLSRDRIRGEIGSMFAGDIPARRDSSEITVFKSLGNAVQDLYLAGTLLSKDGITAPIFNLEA